MNDLIYLVIRCEDDGGEREQQRECIMAFADIDIAMAHAKSAMTRAAFILENELDENANEFDPTMRLVWGNVENLQYIIQPVPFIAHPI